MNQTRLIAVGILIVGLVLVSIGLYVALKPESANAVASGSNVVTSSTSVSSTPPPKNSSPTCVTSYPSGSCWTISNPPTDKGSSMTSDSKFTRSSVEENGNTCKIILAASNSEGVKGCRVTKGQKIEISASGTSLFSTDHPRVRAEGMRGWYDPGVDSPFTQNVGGLEFSIGSLDKNRFFAGDHYAGNAEESGELIFRVVERLSGYADNKGGLEITVKR